MDPAGGSGLFLAADSDITGGKNAFVGPGKVCTALCAELVGRIVGRAVGAVIGAVVGIGFTANSP